MTNLDLFSVNAAIEPLNQLRGPYGECIAYPEEGGDGDGPTGFYLLPMTSRETKSDHVFLSEPPGLAQPFYALSQGGKELFVIDQACLLGDLGHDHHEQISWTRQFFRSSSRGVFISLLVRDVKVRGPVATAGHPRQL